LDLSGLDYVAAGAAAAAAGAINALAGGGTLISFPTLLAIGVPAVSANVTNTVALSPGYLSGTWAQRDDLRPQLKPARALAVAAAAGGLVGSILLVVIPAGAFRASVPYLLLLACGLLWFQDRLRPQDTAEDQSWRPAALPAIFLASTYGGFFGAGLGIILLAVLGLFSPAPLVKLNALKQGLSFVVNTVAALFFVFSGKVVWPLVPVMAVTAIAGAYAGGRLVRVIPSLLLRRLVVIAGVAVAIVLFVV
jgi:uncharacterized membrane protein YfcA